MPRCRIIYGCAVLVGHDIHLIKMNLRDVVRRTLMCSGGIMVKVMEGCLLEQALVMAAVTSAMVSTVDPLTAMMMLRRRVERQHGIRAAGVDGAQE